jgi:hypothetical protein
MPMRMAGSFLDFTGTAKPYGTIAATKQSISPAESAILC